MSKEGVSCVTVADPPAQGPEVQTCLFHLLAARCFGVLKPLISLMDMAFEIRLQALHPELQSLHPELNKVAFCALGHLPWDLDAKAMGCKTRRIAFGIISNFSV